MYNSGHFFRHASCVTELPLNVFKFNYLHLIGIIKFFRLDLTNAEQDILRTTGNILIAPEKINQYLDEVPLPASTISLGQSEAKVTGTTQ